MRYDFNGRTPDMPPPRLPKAAAGLASAVSETAIEITLRQETGVSHSDISRGVTHALSLGLTVIDHEFAKVVCDEAHARAVHGQGHSDGFCRGCALTYEAVNAAVTAYRAVEPISVG